MSTQQKKAELLTFGYVKKSYAFSVPISLIQLMRLYYDKYYYLCLKDGKLQKFFSAKNGERLYFTKLRIKGIEFEMIARPNGYHNIPHSEGIVFVGIAIKNVPKDIEYFDYYQEIKCETLDFCMDKQPKHTNKDNDSTAGPICKLSQLKKLQRVDFNCLIDIKYIKYKKESKKKDYIGPINKLHKISKYKWNINGSMMEKCKEMQLYEKVLSDNFDDNNWCLRLHPNGDSVDNKGYIGIYVQCSSISLNEKTINVKCTISIDGFIDDDSSFMVMFGYKNDAYLSYGYHKLMTLSQFKMMQSISFEVILEIINVFDGNNEEIHASKWDKYGIIE